MPDLKLTPPAIRVEANDDGSELTLLVYDVIGVDFWGDGVSAKSIVQELQANPTAKSIRVRINSAGGDVFDAAAIYTALSQHPAQVHVEIEGMALSAASMIAMAGDSIAMSEASYMMLHNPWTWSVGDSVKLRRDADLLDKIAGQLVTTYAARTGQDEAEVKAWLDAETWFTATEAKDAGLVDLILEAKQPLAAVGRPDKFNNAPDGIAARFVTRAAAMAQTSPPEKEDMPEEDQTPTPSVDKAEDTTEQPDTPEAPDTPEPDTANDPQPEPEQPADENDDAILAARRTEAKRYVDAFGEDLGRGYFADGLSFEAARDAYTVALRQQNADLQARLDSMSRGEDEPVNFQPADEGNNAKAKYAKALDGKAERGVASLAARFAADKN